MKPMFIVRPCSTGAAYEGILKRQAKLNLNECSERLREKGYEQLAVTDYVMIVKKGYEITLFPSGRVLVKDTDSIESARAIIEQLHKDLGLYEN